MAETNWSLRAAQPEDERFLENLYAQVHAADFAGAALPDEQMRGLLQMQARAQRLGYLRDFPVAIGYVVIAEEQPIGRLLVDYGSAAIHLVDIALLPEWQRRGIGTELNQRLIAEAKAQKLPVRLSVRPGTPAMQLYARLGFRITAGGVHIAMEWTPQQEPASSEPQVSAGKAVAREDEAAGENLEVLFTRLTHRRFSTPDAPVEITLERVQRYHSANGGSFSLFFHGALKSILAQGIHTLHLLGENNQPEREFAMFLVPIGPSGDAMQYEAVFNL